jgi:hypothetical protein
MKKSILLCGIICLAGCTLTPGVVREMQDNYLGKEIYICSHSGDFWRLYPMGKYTVKNITYHETNSYGRSEVEVTVYLEDENLKQHTHPGWVLKGVCTKEEYDKTKREIDEEMSIAKAKCNDCYQARKKAEQRKKEIVKEIGEDFEELYERVSGFEPGGVFIDNNEYFVYTTDVDYYTGERFRGNGLLYKQVGNYKYKTTEGTMRSVPAYRATKFEASELDIKTYLKDKNHDCGDGWSCGRDKNGEITHIHKPSGMMEMMGYDWGYYIIKDGSFQEVSKSEYDKTSE